MQYNTGTELQNSLYPFFVDMKDFNGDLEEVE